MDAVRDRSCSNGHFPLSPLLHTSSPNTDRRHPTEARDTHAVVVPLTQQAVRQYVAQLDAACPTPLSSVGGDRSSEDGSHSPERCSARVIRAVIAFVSDLPQATPLSAAGRPSPIFSVNDGERRLESEIHHIGCEQLRQMYLANEGLLLDTLYDCVTLEENMFDMSDHLIYLKDRVARGEEELAVLQVQLDSAEETCHSVLVEKTEVLRRLTEAKGELALVSRRNVRLQQQLSALEEQTSSPLAPNREVRSSSIQQPTEDLHKTILTLREELAVVRGALAIAGVNRGPSSHRLNSSHMSLDGGESPEKTTELPITGVSVGVCDGSGSVSYPVDNSERQPLASAGGPWKSQCFKAPVQVDPLRTEANRSRRCSELSTTSVAGLPLPSPGQLRRLERELAVTREQGRRQAAVESKLLNNLSHLSRQLRARESLDRELRTQRCIDRGFTREKALEELTACRQTIVEQEATIAAYARLASGEPVMRDYAALPEARVSSTPRRLESSPERRRRRESLLKMLESFRHSTFTRDATPTALLSSQSRGSSLRRPDLDTLCTPPRMHNASQPLRQAVSAKVHMSRTGQRGLDYRAKLSLHTATSGDPSLRCRYPHAAAQHQLSGVPYPNTTTASVKEPSRSPPTPGPSTVA